MNRQISNISDKESIVMLNNLQNRTQSALTAQRDNLLATGNSLTGRLQLPMEEAADYYNINGKKEYNDSQLMQ